MKHLLKTVFTLIAASIFSLASAQTGAYLKYDLNGKTMSLKSDQLNNYNQYEAGDENERAHNEHVFYVGTLAKQVYQLSMRIHTPPHTDPVAGKMPYVQTVFYSSSPYPSVHLSITKNVGEDYEFYSSGDNTPGHFEITKVAAGWVEGKFDIELPRDYSDDGEVLHITNGSFRFKIDKETK